MPNEITKASISFVSLVARGANREKFFLMKSDDAGTNYETQVPIIAKSDEKQTIYGVVYAPNVVDTQGDFMKSETIEAVAHDYMLKSQAVDKDHTFKSLDSAKVVESYIAPCDMTIEGAKIAKGAWVMATKITDNKVWEQVKKGEISAYSIGGTGERVKVKDNVKKEAADASEDDEVRGFINVMKSFFTGEKITKDANIKTFSTVIAAKDVMENMWRINDTLSSVMRGIIENPEIKDKKALLNKAIDEYATYMKSRVSKIDNVVTKSDEDFFAERIEKVGAKFSGKNKKAIQETISALNELIADGTEGGNEVTKTELSEIMKEQMDVINKRFDKIEKGDEPEKGKDEITKSDVEEIMKSFAGQIDERFSRLEKSKGVSKQADDNGNQEPVKKSNSKYTGNYFPMA